MPSKRTIMLVDPVRSHLGRTEHHLVNSGFKVLCAEKGQDALQRLTGTPVDVLLWDADTADVSVLDALSELKQNDNTREIPVVVQRLVWNDDEVIAAMRAGAYYYLRKSFNFCLFRSLVEAAIADPNHTVRPWTERSELPVNQGLMVTTEFRFRTLEETKEITNYISATCRDADRLQMGLWEIMINAVEHGNLAISYAEKSQLVDKGLWDLEVAHRLSSPELSHRFATVECEPKDDWLIFKVRDQGTGFDRQPYMEISKARAVDLHGRGIALAASLCFEKIEFQGDGNEVDCWYRDVASSGKRRA